MSNAVYFYKCKTKTNPKKTLKTSTYSHFRSWSQKMVAISFWKDYLFSLISHQSLIRLTT